jgi:3-methylcrotonyl-CoA carboxylase alpha subunit
MQHHYCVVATATFMLNFGVSVSNFLPDTGPLLHVNTPDVSENVRLETGFIQGDEVSVHYDPMIAKLVVRGEDRNDALRVLKRALDSYNVSSEMDYSSC